MNGRTSPRYPRGFKPRSHGLERAADDLVDFIAGPGSLQDSRHPSAIPPWPYSKRKHSGRDEGVGGGNPRRARQRVHSCQGLDPCPHSAQQGRFSMRDFVPIPYGHRGGVCWPRPTQGRLSTHLSSAKPARELSLPTLRLPLRNRQGRVGRAIRAPVSAFTITPRSIPATPKGSLASPASCTARQSTCPSSAIGSPHL